MKQGEVISLALLAEIRWKWITKEREIERSNCDRNIGLPFFDTYVPFTNWLNVLPFFVQMNEKFFSILTKKKNKIDDTFSIYLWTDSINFNISFLKSVISLRAWTVQYWDPITRIINLVDLSTLMHKVRCLILLIYSIFFLLLKKQVLTVK